MSELLRIGALPGYEPEIGRWLWAMGAVRRKTIGLVRDMDQAMLDWRGEREQENSIGTLLYHIALVSWLFGDILEEDLP